MIELTPTAAALLANVPWLLVIGLLLGLVSLPLHAAEHPLAWFLSTVSLGLVMFFIFDMLFVIT